MTDNFQDLKVMVIDDSIIRSGLKVARALGLGGLSPEVRDGPAYEIDRTAQAPSDWVTLEGDGTVRRLSLDVGQVNAAFAAMGDPRAAARALTDPPETTFIDMELALVSVPSIGEAVLGEAEARNLRAWLGEGEQAIAVVGRGLYSFKGSGYVRGGIFDRIVLIQDDVSVRFRDRDHRRMGPIAAEGAPDFAERDLFRIPADAGFDPTRPFRLQLLVQREVAAIEKVFTTFELGYQLPARYLRAVAPPAPVAQVEDGDEAQAAWAAEGARVGYLEQEPQLDPTKDVLGNVMEGVGEQKALVERYNELAMNYSDETADEMAALQDQIDAQNLWDLESQVEQAMDALRESVGLRGYGQKDPLIEYKNEGYDMFLEMMTNMRRNVIYSMFMFQPQAPKN